MFAVVVSVPESVWTDGKVVLEYSLDVLAVGVWLEHIVLAERWVVPKVPVAG